MKKLVSLISAFIMCTVMTLPVFSVAEEESEEVKNDSKTFEHSEMISNVELVDMFKSSYTVTIPDGKADLSKSVEFKISASNVVIGKNQTLDISVRSENEWRLLNVDTVNEPDENKEYVAYELVPTSLTYISHEPIPEKNYSEEVLSEDLSVTDPESETEIKSEQTEIPLTDKEKQPLTNENNIILSIEPKEAENITITKILTATVTEDARLAGMYTDVLTFKVEINGELVSNTSETESLSDENAENKKVKSNSEPEQDNMTE
ncbi:MAG: hypothetical protein K2J39_08155 [Ruminococcus sp.]|nr:hypothetical protein [Ruminococcus sp.]